MSHWHPRPRIYEINTRVWLDELRSRHGPHLTLSNIPAAVWDSTAGGFDAVWLMGVWERSPAGIAIANQNPGLLADFRRALPDYRSEDNAGSPYCIRRYEVDAHLGGREGLAAARAELARRGLRLILDFVPNHVAPDHPWVYEHPDFFVQGSAADLARDPEGFFDAGRAIIARGRDPYFPAWPDVLQLNAFQADQRQAVIATLLDIAAQCDGVRCDMAMLMTNAIFSRTWGAGAGAIPAVDYWPLIIPAVRQEFPDFLFMAEVYWDMEWELQQQGFDFCYDKRLYDRLEAEGAEAVRLHLAAGLDYQAKLVRFLENHDEARAAAVFEPARHRAVAVAAYTLPGARLFHEGQFEGRRVKLPVFLGRRPAEAPDRGLFDFYHSLLTFLAQPSLRDGDWHPCPTQGWPDNPSHAHMVAWTWTAPDDRCLVIANLSGAPVQGRVELPWPDLTAHQWALDDVLGGPSFVRSGADMAAQGLHIELAAWGYHCFCLRQVGKSHSAG